MTQFSVPWNPRALRTYPGFPAKAVGGAVLLGLVAAAGQWATRRYLAGHPAGTLLLVIGPALTALGLLGAALVVKTWRAWGPILLRLALPLFVGAIIGTCFLTWGVNLLFEWVRVDLAVRADDPAVHGYFGAALSLVELERALPALPTWVCGLIWTLQFPLVRDVISLLAIVGLFNVIPVFLIWWERKVAGRIQSRLGPMRVGGWHGWAQSFADGIKLVLKEDLIPRDADSVLFRLAPYLAIVPSLLAFIALPFGVTYVFRELDVALIFVLAMLGIEVVGVILAGWASNNKWSVYGAMREACQMVSYEIPMGMALLVPIVCVGSLSLRVIGEAQSGGWFAWLAFSNPFAFVAFVSYYIASLASCKRAPFDLPEAESELVAGFHTEYSGFRWALFFFAEYAAMFVVCGLATALFLGGWGSPLPASWSGKVTEWFGTGLLARGVSGLLIAGPIWFMAKCLFLLYVQIWLRWTLPRIRIDQVLYACVQVLLPLTMLLLLGATLWTWASTSSSWTWGWIAAATNWVLGLLGMGFALVFPVIALYGFYHRRRLVGNLVVDPLPGA
ncbi:MAG: NADH-quinone oxidoreductase subunit NuoH [Planctomycetes bacterium]|nr:NADH-quinone oxidoreductase subunit NuoH [Planctomycetota bacterium]